MELGLCPFDCLLVTLSIKIGTFECQPPIACNWDLQFTFMWFYFFQRQSERIKREKAQLKRGDDSAPQAEPESLVPVARFGGSRLASGPSPSPYQPGGTSRRDQLRHGTSSLSILDIQSEHSGTVDEKGSVVSAKKVARLSSGATIGAAIVEAENSLEIEVCFPS